MVAKLILDVLKVPLCRIQKWVKVQHSLGLSGDEITRLSQFEPVNLQLPAELD